MRPSVSFYHDHILISQTDTAFASDDPQAHEDRSSIETVRISPEAAARSSTARTAIYTPPAGKAF